MILFHAKRDGTVTTTPDLVPQGSSMQDLVVVSEFAYAYCAIRPLPASGEYIEDIPCDMILKKDGTIIWTASLPPQATVVAGSVDYQLIFTAADGTTQTTLVGRFTVPRGVPVSTPPTVGELSAKTVADFYTILSNLYVAYVGHERDIYQSIVDIAALKKTIASTGYVTIPASEWNDGTPTIASFTIDGFGVGMTALLTPVDPATQTAAREARLSAYPEVFTIDGDTQTVEIIRANADKAPEIPLRFAYLILKTEATIAPSVAIIGVDAYGDGGGTGGGVDSAAVEEIVTRLVPGWARQEEPPADAVKSVNGKTGDVTLGASDVGARPDSWMPTAEDVKARPNTWTPSASDVGADTAGTASAFVAVHNTNETAHNDIRLLIEQHEESVNALLNSDDDTLNETKEIVAYIKSNKSLIDSITGSKVNVSDIINNLTTNVTNKPLSAAQGVALKALIDGLQSGKLDAAALTAAKLAQVLGYTPANVSNVPTKLSQLEGDSTHRTVTDTEKSAWNNKIDLSALAPYLTSSKAAELYQTKGNYVTAVSGKGLSTHDLTNELKAKYDGKIDKTGISLGIASDGLIYVYVDGAPVGTGIPQGQSGDVFGYVDENNNVVLTGNLADGTYTIKYEVEDAGGNIKTINIGDMVLDTNVYYSVESNLTNCTNDNSVKTVVAGSSYIATISANSGYELKSVNVTMGGSAVSVTGGAINIASVTGNIVITAVAEEVVTVTNFADPNDENWKVPYRINSSYAEVQETDMPYMVTTNYIAVKPGDVISVTGIDFKATTYISYSKIIQYNNGTANNAIGANSNDTEFVVSGGVTTITFKKTTPWVQGCTHIRLTGKLTGAASAVVINIKRNGEWL